MASGSHTVPDAVGQQPWTIEHALTAGDIRFELRRFHMPTPHEMISEMPEPVLALSMDRLPAAEMRPCGASPRSPFRKLGRLVFSPPLIPYDARGDGGDVLVASFSVAPRHFSLLTQDFEWDERRLLACVDICAPSVEAALARLAQEAISPGFASDVLLEGAAAMMVVELARFLRAQNPLSAPAMRLFSSAEIALIENVIAQDEAATLESIAAKCGIGVRTLTRVFKATTGRTIGAVVAERRICRAMTLLRDHSVPLKVIAYRTGFASASSFVSAFRRESGMTPGAYRRQWPGGRLAN